MTEYIWDPSVDQEQHRLAALCDLYDQGTVDLLAELQVGPGWKCLEVAAGTGTIARWLAERVGKTGKVVATDLDTRFLESADRHGLEIRRHDVANELLEEGEYDLVHARALLEHLPGWEGVLQKMTRALKPGGWLVLEDFVLPPAVDYPQIPALGKVLNAIRAGLRAAGGDADFGVRLQAALQNAGLVDVRSAARVPVIHSGTPSVDLAAMSIEQLGPRLVKGGLLTDVELRQTVNDLRAPGCTLLGLILVGAWGRRNK